MTTVPFWRYYTKNSRLIPTAKRGKEIQQQWNQTKCNILPDISVWKTNLLQRLKENECRRKFVFQTEIYCTCFNFTAVVFPFLSSLWGSVSDISFRHSFLCKNIDVFIWEAGLARLPRSRVLRPRSGGRLFCEPRAASPENSLQNIQKWSQCPNMIFITCGVDHPRKMESNEIGVTKSNRTLTTFYSFSEFPT